LSNFRVYLFSRWLRLLLLSGLVLSSSYRLGLDRLLLNRLSFGRLRLLGLSFGVRQSFCRLLLLFFGLWLIIIDEIARLGDGLLFEQARLLDDRLVVITLSILVALHFFISNNRLSLGGVYLSGLLSVCPCSLPFLELVLEDGESLNSEFLRDLRQHLWLDIILPEQFIRVTEGHGHVVIFLVLAGRGHHLIRVLLLFLLLRLCIVVH